MYKCLVRENHRLMLFKKRLMRKTVRTKGAGTSSRLGNNCTFKICVKYYMDYEVKDMRWVRNVEGMGREKCLENLKNVTTWKRYLWMGG